MARTGDGSASKDTRLVSAGWACKLASVQGLHLDPDFRRGERCLWVGRLKYAILTPSSPDIAHPVPRHGVQHICQREALPFRWQDGRVPEIHPCLCVGEAQRFQPLVKNMAHSIRVSRTPCYLPTFQPVGTRGVARPRYRGAGARPWGGRVRVRAQCEPFRPTARGAACTHPRARLRPLGGVRLSHAVPRDALDAPGSRPGSRPRDA